MLQNGIAAGGLGYNDEWISKTCHLPRGVLEEIKQVILMDLDERKKKILESIIRDYVATAEPVGSRAIARKADIHLSAATIRNEMSDLEQMGYLEQPHTSAGRIPSQMGLRYFVDCMMKQETLSDQEMDQLRASLLQQINNWNNVVQEVGQFLSRMTNYVSFIILPALRFEQIRNIQIVPLQEGLALLVIVTDMGVVLHQKISVPADMKPEEFQLIARTFGEVLHGRGVNSLHRSQLQVLREQMLKEQRLLDTMLDTIDHLMNNSREEKIMINGLMNVLNEPEFKNLEQLRSILSLMEEQDNLKRLVPDDTGNEVGIRIGKENRETDSQQLSLVFSGLRFSEQQGKIGLVGPIRMEYWKAAGTLDSVRLVLEDILDEMNR